MKKKVIIALVAVLVMGIVAVAGAASNPTNHVDIKLTFVPSIEQKFVVIGDRGSVVTNEGEEIEVTDLNNRYLKVVGAAVGEMNNVPEPHKKGLKDAYTDLVAAGNVTNLKFSETSKKVSVELEEKKINVNELLVTDVFDLAVSAKNDKDAVVPCKEMNLFIVSRYAHKVDLVIHRTENGEWEVVNFVAIEGDTRNIAVMGSGDGAYAFLTDTSAYYADENGRLNLFQ